MRDPIGELLPPEWLRSEWLILSQQEPGRRVVDPLCCLEPQRGLLAQLERKCTDVAVQIAYEEVAPKRRESEPQPLREQWRESQFLEKLKRPPFGPSSVLAKPDA